MLLTLILLLNGAWARGEILVRVRPHVTAAAGQNVRLSDLCDVTDGDADVAKDLGAVVVATSPARVSTARLAEVLRPVVAHARERGVTLRLNLPGAVTVAPAPAFDDAAVARELIALWQPACAECKLEIENINLPRVANVREWSIKTRPELPRGSFSVSMNLIRANTAPLTGWVSGRLVVKKSVPVAKRLVQTGEKLTAEDYAFELRDVAQAIDGLPTTADLTIKHARRGLRAGEIIFAGALEKERAVRRGDIVQLKTAERDFEVSVSVTSPQDAFVGDVVSFKNARTNNVILGQVTGPGQAEMQGSTR